MHSELTPFQKFCAKNYYRAFGARGTEYLYRLHLVMCHKLATAQHRINELESQIKRGANE
jgi:hypothetical protein